MTENWLKQCLFIQQNNLSITIQYTYRLYDNNMYTYIQGDPGKSL